MRIIDTGDAILSGDNHPQLKIGDKLYLVDDRKSTWDKIQQVQKRGGDNVDAEILALALGKEAVAELVNSDISVSGVVCFKRLIHHDMSKSLKTYKATKQKGDPHEQTENNRPV